LNGIGKATFANEFLPDVVSSLILKTEGKILG